MQSKQNTQNQNKKELQRIFEFIVKYHNSTTNWKNSDTRNFIRWALFYKKLFIVYDGKRIAGVGVAWRVEHPENAHRDLKTANRESGNYLHVYRVIIHPEYRKRKVLFLLLSMAVSRFKGVDRVFWESHSRGKNKLFITKTDKLLGVLSNG